MPRLLSSRSIYSILLAGSLALPMAVVNLTFAQDTPAPATPAPATPATPAPATPAAGGDAGTPATPAPATPATPAAGDAGATPAPAATPAVNLPENEPLQDSIENFWHYAKIARYDVAAAEGKRILDANTEPTLLLGMFEKVADLHHDNLDVCLIRWQGVPAMSDISTQLINALNKGHDARRADPTYIEANIKLLSENERGYVLAVDRLRDSGELAVPIMIDDLMDGTKATYHAPIRRALRDLGLSAVNPLLAATEMKNESTLMTVIDTLGDLGYDVAVPYLAKLQQDPSQPQDVKAALGDAMRRLRISDPSSLNPAQEFYDLAEKFYYDNSAVRAEKKNPIGRIWYWGEDKHLTFVAVPQPIFHDVMAKRAAEYALKLTQGSGDVSDSALALWVSAAFQDEAELPAGQKDATLAADAPTAHYWGSSVGTKYLNMALSRANRDRNAAVAIRVVQSLQDVGGQANLFGGTEHPLMDALVFPDRLVRYEAAFALANALPRQSFVGEERVVPLLAEALSQTGSATVLVMAPTQDQLNGLMDGLKGQGYTVVGGKTPEEAVANAAARPTVDAIVMPEEAGTDAIQQLEALSMQTPRLERAVKVIITKSKATPFAVQAVTDPTISTTQANPTDLPSLKAAIEDARKRGGSLPLDADTATKYATKAADLLAKIAINRSPVYDIGSAQPLLLAALDDSRADIVKDDCTVLGLMDGQDIQPALLQKATTDATPDEIKVATFKALSTNARNFGNKLNDDQVAVVQKTVATAPNLDVKTAASEARGALDLPADQAKKLIMDQSKVTN
jgi:hypothetical protein